MNWLRIHRFKLGLLTVIVGAILVCAAFRMDMSLTAVVGISLAQISLFILGEY